MKLVMCIVVVVEFVIDIDVSVVDWFVVLYVELVECGIVMNFVEMKGLVKDCLCVYGLFDVFGVVSFFLIVIDVVVCYVW